MNKITGIFERGFNISIPELHFLSSSFGITTAEDLTRFMSGDNSDADLISELVIAPDETIQVGLEFFLCEAGFTETDERAITETLSDIKPETGFIFSEAEGMITFRPDNYLMGRFVRKLRIVNNPAERIYTASGILFASQRLKMLVRLRNAGVNFCDKAVSFISEFIKKEAFKGRNFETLFDFAVSHIEENSGTSDLKDFFIDKKRSYEKNLRTIKQVNRQMKASAIETLMMQGTRIPPGSEEEIQFKLEMSEKILAVMFGYFDFKKPDPTDVSLGNISGKDRIEKTISLLS